MSEKTHAEIDAEALRDALKDMEATVTAATAENSSAVGNAAKLREAVGKSLGIVDHLQTRYSLSGYVAGEVSELKIILEAALAAPPRQCDMGTADEQAYRFYRFCMANSSAIKGMCDSKCPCIDSGDKCHCLTKWAQLPYEESEATDGK